MEQDNLLRQLLLLAVGATALVVDKVREVSDEWVQSGRLRPDQATALINELVGRMTQGPDWEAHLRRQMRDVLRELGLASQQEVDELRGRIDRLERQVRDLENRLWR